jgi:hypothetical protein
VIRRSVCREDQFAFSFEPTLKLCDFRSERSVPNMGDKIGSQAELASQFPASYAKNPTIPKANGNSTLQTFSKATIPASSV